MKSQDSDNVGGGTRPTATDDSTGLPWPRSWRGVYLFVFGCFVLVVIALTLFSRFFA